MIKNNLPISVSNKNHSLFNHLGPSVDIFKIRNFNIVKSSYLTNTFIMSTAKHFFSKNEKFQSLLKVIYLSSIKIIYYILKSSFANSSIETTTFDNPKQDVHLQNGINGMSTSYADPEGIDVQRQVHALGVRCICCVQAYKSNQSMQLPIQLCPISL